MGESKGDEQVSMGACQVHEALVTREMPWGHTAGVVFFSLTYGGQKKVE